MKRLEEIEARLSAATPGQWWVGGFDGHLFVKGTGRDEFIARPMSKHRKDDAALIAAAPSDLRYLLDFAKAAGPVLKTLRSVGCACRGQVECVTCDDAAQALALLECP